MTWAEGRKIIRVYSAPAESDFPALLPWKDKYLSPDNFVLVLGESLTRPVTVNLTNIPHILLGGSTGSGKSVLLKLLLMQALRKGAEVYIADFKGGVDFPKVWRQKCHMCFQEDTLLYVLGQFVAVLEARKKWFDDAGCDNLDAFNKATGEGLPRLVFACDEVAELLDRTGRSKEDRDKLNQIEGRLATLARLGRAFGIHLILATQRPDANIIPGQIRNNMDFRVCGRAESVLSGIILDNTSAAEQIPKDARGPLYHRGRDSVPGLSARRGPALRLGAAPMARKRKINDYGTGIPVHEVDALARVLLPEIQAFFESEEGQREFAEWKAQQEQDKLKRD